MIGSRVAERYLVEREIGRGGMGHVFLARDETLDRQVALKLLSPTVVGDAEHRKRFRREFEALARAGHPNVVGMYDFGNLPDGGIYYAMEYLPHPSLREVYAASAPLTPERILELCGQLLLALEHLHGQGVVHRDIKPENVVLTAEGRAVLLDFGVVSVQGLTAVTETGQILGTPRHASPELLRGERVDGRSDLFQLGVLAYEGLTGQLPFRGESLAELLQQVELALPDEVCDLRPELDPGWDLFLSRCLAKERGERYPSAKAAAEDLDRLRRGRSLASRLPSGRLRALPSFSSSTSSTLSGGAASPRLAPAWSAWSRRIVLLALGLFVLGGAVWGLRSLSRIGEPPLHGLSVVSIDPDRLELRGSRPLPPGLRFRIRPEGAPPRALSGPGDAAVVPLDGARRLALLLETPLVGKAELVVSSADGRVLWTGGVDGRAVWDRHVRRLRSLRGERLSRLCERILSKRPRLTSLRGDARRAEKARVWGELEPDLAKVGLGGEERRLLRKALPIWLKEGPLPSSAAGEALHALRVLEVTLARSTLCYAPPWGPVSPMLGLRARPGSSDAVDPGWQVLASRPLAVPVGTKLKWSWMSTPRYVRSNEGSFIGGSVVFGPTIRSLLALIDDHRSDVEFFPQASDLRSRLDLSLDLRLPEGRAWPPPRAAVEVTCRLYSAEQCLRCQVNDRGSLPVYNVTVLTQHEDAPSLRQSLPTQTLHHPVDPAWLRPGTNHLSLTVEAMPGNEVVHALSLRRIRIVASWEEGD